MAYAQYRIELRTSDNIVLQPSLMYFSAQYVLKERGLGSLTLRVPPSYGLGLFRKHSRLLIYRSINGAPAYLEGDATWILTSRRYTVDENGVEGITLTAQHANMILARRIVAYSAGSAQASKSGAVDTIMRAIIDENFISAADTARNLASGVLALGAVAGTGPTIAKSFCRDNVLNTLEDLANSAALAGTYTGYEVRTLAGALTFVVYLTQRGVDRTVGSGNDLIFSPGNRNLVNIDLDEDWTDEVTFVYAGGQGEGVNRVIQSASNSAAIGESVLGRAERFRDARNSTTTTQVQDEADDALYAARTVRRFSGSAQDTEGCTYGVHYRWGDRVTAQILDQQFDCRVDPVNVSLAREGGEVLDIRLEATNE
jgi:Siphovirus ReqiPepy6 Gp37-like protein